MIRVILASASPRRRELLRQLGIEPICAPQHLDESPTAGEAPRDHVLRLAQSKARAAHARLGPGEPAVVLGADTVVVLDGAILGKPADEADALAMLLRLRGRTHDVWTGLCVLDTRDGCSVHEAARTRVRFRSYDERTARWYVGTGEPMDKAGAYGIQGRGAALCRAIVGSWSNVAGLPLERVPDCLARVGLDWRDLANRPGEPRHSPSSSA